MKLINELTNKDIKRIRQEMQRRINPFILFKAQIIEVEVPTLILKDGIITQKYSEETEKRLARIDQDIKNIIVSYRSKLKELQRKIQKAKGSSWMGFQGTVSRQRH